MDSDLILMLEAIRQELRALSLKEFPDTDVSDERKKEARDNADFLANKVIRNYDLSI